MKQLIQIIKTKLSNNNFEGAIIFLLGILLFALIQNW